MIFFGSDRSSRNANVCLSVRLSVRVSRPNLSRAGNLHLSFSESNQAVMEHPENTKRELKENTQRALRAHSESTQGALREQQESNKRATREHSERN